MISFLYRSLFYLSPITGAVLLIRLKRNLVSYSSDFVILIIGFIAAQKSIEGDLAIYRDFYLTHDLELVKEPIHYVWSYLFSSIGFSFRFFVFFHVALSFSLIKRAINKVTTNDIVALLALVSLCFFIEIFEQSNHLMRQFLGGAFLINAIVSDSKKDRISYTILAVLTHSSSLIGFIFFVSKKYLKETIIIGVIILVVISVFRIWYVDRIFKILVGDVVQIDRVSLGRSGELYFYFVCVVNTVLFVFSSEIRHNTAFGRLIVLQFLIFGIYAFLPATFHVFRYRMLLYSFVFITVEFLTSVGLVLSKYQLGKFNIGRVVLFTIGVLSLLRFLMQLEDNYAYDLSLYKVFINV